MTVYKTIEKHWRNFLWKGNNETTSSHLISWSKVTTPKEKSGLGSQIWEMLTLPSIANESRDFKPNQMPYGEKSFGQNIKVHISVQSQLKENSAALNPHGVQSQNGSVGLKTITLGRWTMVNSYLFVTGNGTTVALYSLTIEDYFLSHKWKVHLSRKFGKTIEEIGTYIS